MTIFHAIILSIIQGITEFLPISSTGHMILAVRAMGIPETDFLKSFEIIIQLGSILAVIFLYSKRILTDRRSWFNVAIAFIPSGITGFFLYRIIKQFLLGNPFIVVLSLCIGGVILLIIEKHLKVQQKSIRNLTPFQSFGIGVFQILSMVPGVSRSASTIIGGLLTGLSRKDAVEFSFLLAIPTMIIATGFDLVQSSTRFTPEEIQLIGIGFVGAFVTAFLAVKSFVAFVQNHSFSVFGVYRIILAILYWVFIINA